MSINALKLLDLKKGQWLISVIPSLESGAFYSIVCNDTQLYHPRPPLTLFYMGGSRPQSLIIKYVPNHVQYDFFLP